MINPITWTDSMLTSTTAVDTGAPLWLVGTAYLTGEAVRLDTTHKEYEALSDNTGFSPDTNPLKWLETGDSNTRRMFDSKWGTQTTASTTLTVEMTPLLALDSMALLNLLGTEVHITSTVAGIGTVYDRTISLQTDIGVYDWQTYFLAPIVTENDVVITDLLPYYTQVITVTVTGPATVAVGGLTFGSITHLGDLQFSPTLGIIDYSKKEADIYGNVIVTERAYAKRFNAKFVLDNTFVDQLASILASIRAKPVIWIGGNLQFSSLVVWGFFKDFEIDIAYPTFSYCSITIEGIT